MRRHILGKTFAFLALLSLFFNIGASNSAAHDTNVTRSVQIEEASWPMAGANPERTSWTAEEVRGELQPLWYKPFEPYISQKVQIIAAYNTLYVSTARGLYALDAESGAQRWVYPTALPLGHSPTIQNGVAYVGGLDHKLYAIDAFTGSLRWTFEAGAGFETNPLVVAGKVYAGNRDGIFYAVYTDGPQVGRLAWKYQTEGPILFSAAYKDGLVYFASQDSHAYALDAQNGALVWKSAKLPGAGFHSFWPVVYRDRVIFAGSRNYHSNSRFLSGGKDTALETQDIYPNRQLDPDGTLVGPVGQEPGDWAPGTLTLNASQSNVTSHGQTTPITEYFETKPWRRTVFVMDRQSGRETTYDFDGDGRPEYAPILWFGTHSGNRYPPVVGGDGVLYMSNNYQSSPAIPWGHITGWKLDTPFLSLPAPGRNAIDEPQGYAAGGNLIYWNRCCDRVGASFDLGHPGTEWTYFSYNLDSLLPGYNQRYYNPDPVDYTHVFAAFGGPNGVYGFHADTNPPIPYHGKVYMHRSNAIIAFAPSSSAPQALPLAETVTVPPPQLTFLGPDGLKTRLAQEVQKMLAAGHLRPGYASHGHFDLPSQYQCGDDLGDYFHHPAETILTLVEALPYLPESMQPQVEAYLQSEFSAYPPYQYNHIGWQNGAAREAFDLPPEVAGGLAGLPPETGITGFVWGVNPYSFYALWKYAAWQNDPVLAQQLLTNARNNRGLIDSLLNVPDSGVLAKMPFVHNAYIAGYLGYLGLERQAGQPESSQIRQELDRLMQLRASQFNKNSAYATADTREEGAYCRTLNVASNFMFLVPELGDYLHDHALAKVQGALAEYEQIAPYWFVSFAEEGFGENALNPLYDSQAVFLAKAWILKEPGAELEKYLDVPAFARGDLFYIQKLVAAIENQSQGCTTACAVTTGVFRPTNGLVYLKNSTVSGFADVVLNYGLPGDYPVAGDWNGDGIDSIGVYRNGSFYLRNSNTLGYADLQFPFGTPGDQPVVGDWNGDGVDTIGVFHSSSFTFYLRNSNAPGPADMVFSLGIPGDVGIAGDWNGDGKETTGVFRPSNGIIFLKNTNATGYADIALNFGLPGDRPVIGDWDNDGIDTIGVYRNGTFYLRNSNMIGFAEIFFALGIPGDLPIAGNWDGLP
jgi:putative pyrroloquinoline-quinone binding quinoprotein